MSWRAALRMALADIDEPVMQPPMNRLTAMPPAPTRAPRSAIVTEPRGLENDDLAGRLERATIRAIERSEDLMELTVDDEGDEKFGDKVRGLNAIIKTIIGTQVRVDEHRLKARKLDVLPQLLEAIEAEEKRRALA